MVAVRQTVGRRGRVRVVIDTLPLFNPPGDVDKWARKVGVELKTTAIAYAPPNRSSSFRPFLRKQQSSGWLVHSIKSGLQREAEKVIAIVLRADAPHAKWVLEGTASQGRRFIYTSLGWANKAAVDLWIKNREFTFAKGEAGFVMPLPASALDKNRFHMRVKGQRANPFLTDAYVTVAKKHPELPSKRFRWTLLD